MDKTDNTVRRYKVEKEYTKRYLDNAGVSLEEERLRLFLELLRALPPSKLDKLFNFNAEDVSGGLETRISASIII